MPRSLHLDARPVVMCTFMRQRRSPQSIVLIILFFPDLSQHYFTLFFFISHLLFRFFPLVFPMIFCPSTCVMTLARY